MTQALPKFLILAGDGINCERETAAAFLAAGGDAQIMHVNDLTAAPEKLDAYDGLAIPGGFSFGDELGSGQIMALKLRYKLGDALKDFVSAKKPVIGICNGFQVLVKLGLLPYPADDIRVAALAPNASGRFIDRWVNMTVPKNICHWLHGMEDQNIRLPMRHGEGRVTFKAGMEDTLLHKLQTDGQIPFTYTEDVNGSTGRIAALTDPDGMILGMMPHPEAFISPNTDRIASDKTQGDGLMIFENMIRYIKGQETSHARRRA